MLNELTFAEGNASGIYLVERDPFFRGSALGGMLGLPKALGVSGDIKGKKFGIERCRLPKKPPLPIAFFEPSSTTSHVTVSAGNFFAEDRVESQTMFDASMISVLDRKRAHPSAVAFDAQGSLYEEDRDGRKVRAAPPRELLLWHSSAFRFSASTKLGAPNVWRTAHRLGEAFNGEGKLFCVRTHDIPAPGAMPRQQFEQFPVPGVLLMAAKNERDIPVQIRDVVFREGETLLARQKAELDPLLISQMKRLVELYPVLKREPGETKDRITVIRREDFVDVFDQKGSIFGKGLWIEEVDDGPPPGPYSVEEATGLIAFRETELRSNPAETLSSKEATAPAHKQGLSETAREALATKIFNRSGVRAA